MLRSTSISLTHKEHRRDRRYVAPPIALRLGGGLYRTRNWSLSGLLLDAAPSYDVGSRLAGELKIEGLAASFPIEAETVRSDPRLGTVACRFIAPSPDLVAALDRAVVARFRRTAAARASAGAALLAAFLLHSGPAAAQSGTLVPGAAPLPSFRLDFPNLMLEPLGPPTAPGDLKISLNSPDKGVIQFLFSPRSRFGIENDPDTGTSRSYAGLAWNLFDNDGFFGNLSLATSLTHPGIEDIYRRDLGPPLAFHSTFEFGYQLGAGHSLTLSLDRATEPDFLTEHGEMDNVRLRYGLKF